jgi:tetratricopeptide (TPR) repeat protein
VFCRLASAPSLITFLFALLLSGCARQSAPRVERLAVLPLENLSSDARFDWFGRGAAAAIAYDLAGANQIFARTIDSSSAAPAMQASRMLEGYFYERKGRIEIRATLEDLGTSKSVKTFDIGGPTNGGVVRLANDLAGRLSSEARAFGTSNEAAFRYYGEALSPGDPQSMEQALQSATAADPRFAAAYLDRARVLAATGNRAQALELIQAAQRTRMDAIDRANLGYTSSTISGDVGERMKALEALAKATPANADVFVELAETQFARREFNPAISNYRAAAQLNPNEPRIWNELGYALARVRDLKGARSALAQYQELAPGDTNPLDSQGEVSFFLGDFESAIRYFQQAAARSPAEWIKAAEAQLMIGNLREADASFLKHLGSAASNAKGGAGYQLAQWEFLTGRRKAGMARMEKLAPALTGDLQSLAFSQLSIWKLETGDGRAASDLANQAAAHAQSPQARNIGSLCRFIASGTTAGSGSKLADAYALLFARKYREALPLLAMVYRETNPSADGQVRSLLAWAYVQTGAVDEAAKLTDLWPLPLSSGEPLFASLMFPRFLFLRGAVLQHKGKQDEARKSYELYLKYAGDVPDQFGDEAKARQSLSATK